MVGSLWRTIIGLLAIGLALATATGAALGLLPPIDRLDRIGLDGWLVRLVCAEWSLLLVGPAVLALLLAGAARWAGTPRTAFWSALLAVLAVLAALVQPVRGIVSASDHGVRPDLLEYFAGTSYGGAGEADDTGPYGSVWRPDGPGPWPAVLLIRDGDDVRPAWNSWLNGQGFVVFDLTERPAAALPWVRASADRYGVDPDRLTLFGFGTGADAALRAAPDADAEALIALYPTADGVRPDGVHPDGALPDGELPRALVIQGGSDLVVEPHVVRRLATDLERTGTRTRYVEIGSADHGFDLNWGGFGNQVARTEIEGFLEPLEE